MLSATKNAIIHIQNKAPAPPVANTKEIPAIFPIPTLEAVEFINAWKGEICSLVYPSFFL